MTREDFERDFGDSSEVHDAERGALEDGDIRCGACGAEVEGFTDEVCCPECGFSGEGD